MRDRLIEIINNCAKQPIMIEGLEHWSDTIADYLLENGVIVPPCKVGDTIYQIRENCICTVGHRYLHNTCNRPTSCQDCPHVEIKRWIIETTFSLSMLDRIGVDFFVTKEQAEKALAEVANGTK